MADWSAIEASIQDATETPFRVTSARALSGGCIHDSWRIDSDDKSYFVKRNTPDMEPVFEAELQGLNEWAQANVIRVPQPIALGTSSSEAWLVLEYLNLGSGSAHSETEFGRQLARLHQVTADQFGWKQDNHIGETPQVNHWETSWVDFYQSYRLQFQFELAKRKGASFRNSNRLLDVVGLYFDGYDPKPALIHGDLWGGNFAYLKNGAPVIFDPATYYADREAEFGLISMFGGLGPKFWNGYNEVYPLDDAFQRRAPLYRLYHELNHYNLFGGGYGVQAQRTIDRLVKREN